MLCSLLLCILAKSGKDLQPKLALSIRAHRKQIDDPIQHNTPSDYCSNRNVVSPEGQHQIERRDLERDKNRLVQLRALASAIKVYIRSIPTKKFHPAMNPYASSTHLLPMRTHPPTTGMNTVISAMQLFASARMPQYSANAMNKLPGPPSTRPHAMDTNSAVPIDPPIAIHWIWRLDKRRCKPSTISVGWAVPTFASLVVNAGEALSS